MTAPVHYGRYPRATTHLVDTDAFLVTRSTIKHLNPTAAVIWLTIEEPATRRDILAVLAEVYPKVSTAALAKDLEGFLRSMSKDGLLVKHHTQGKSKRVKRKG